MLEQQIYENAHRAGMEAANRCTPTPMVVFERRNPLDDSSPVIRQYAPVADGVCGFAWVTIKPANCKMAKYLVGKNLARKAYDGGVSLWVRDFNQSLERKEQYAQAFARVLSDAGIRAYAESRMD